MGRGNYTWRQERRLEGRGSFLLDTDAMFLMARPPFTGRVRDLDKQPRARIDEQLAVRGSPDPACWLTEGLPTCRRIPGDLRSGVRRGQETCAEQRWTTVASG